MKTIAVITSRKHKIVLRVPVPSATQCLQERFRSRKGGWKRRLCLDGSDGVEQTGCRRREHVGECQCDGSFSDQRGRFGETTDSSIPDHQSRPPDPHPHVRVHGSRDELLVQSAEGMGLTCSGVAPRGCTPRRQRDLARSGCVGWHTRAAAQVHRRQLVPMHDRLGLVSPFPRQSPGPRR
jgi:hypothetical protein